MNGILGNLAVNGRQMFTLNATHRILTGRNHNLTCTSWQMVAFLPQQRTSFISPV